MHPTVIDLCRQLVACCWENAWPLDPALVGVLNAIDQRLWVLNAHAHCKGFLLHEHVLLGENFIDIATRIWMGEQFENQEKNLLDVQAVGLKVAQFSFSRLKNADPNLGVEMSSTGEVGCFGQCVEEAFLKSIISVGFRIPAPKSTILVTLGKIKEKD